MFEHSSQYCWPLPVTLTNCRCAHVPLMSSTVVPSVGKEATIILLHYYYALPRLCWCHPVEKDPHVGALPACEEKAFKGWHTPRLKSRYCFGDAVQSLQKHKPCVSTTQVLTARSAFHQIVNSSATNSRRQPRQSRQHDLHTVT